MAKRDQSQGAAPTAPNPESPAPAIISDDDALRLLELAKELGETEESLEALSKVLETMPAEKGEELEAMIRHRSDERTPTDRSQGAEPAAPEDPARRPLRKGLVLVSFLESSTAGGMPRYKGDVVALPESIAQQAIKRKQAKRV